MSQFSRFALSMFVIAGLSGAASVGLSAVAAHGLAHMVPDGPHAVGLFMQAAEFEIDHAIALLIVTLIAERMAEGGKGKAFRIAALFLAAGTIMFPTALYSSALGGPVFWAPWGGTAAIIGWVIVAICNLLALFKRKTAT